MNVKEFLNTLNKIAPFEIAENWDNSGLLVGDYNAPVQKIAVVLDTTPQSIKLAAENNCNVLLCHHPLIFKALKNINTNSLTGRAIQIAIKNDVNIIAAHTNWDKAGLNFNLAELLGLENICVPDLEKPFLVQGVLNQKMPLEKFLTHIKNSWGLSRLDCYAENYNHSISKIALCGGSGSEFWRTAKHFGNEIFITADFKYHDLIDATHSGLIIAVPEHGEMERASLPELVKKIKELANELEFIILDTRALNVPIRI